MKSYWGPVLLVEGTAWKCQDLGKLEIYYIQKLDTGIYHPVKKGWMIFMITLIQANELNGKYPSEELAEYRIRRLQSVFFWLIQPLRRNLVIPPPLTIRVVRWPGLSCIFTAILFLLRFVWGFINATGIWLTSCVELLVNIGATKIGPSSLHPDQIGEVI